MSANFGYRTFLSPQADSGARRLSDVSPCGAPDRAIDALPAGTPIATAERITHFAYLHTRCHPHVHIRSE